jgi:hypothetical protein
MQRQSTSVRNRPVRYAVPGLGWIAQEAVLPSFQNDPTSVLAAIVTGGQEKESVSASSTVAFAFARTVNTRSIAKQRY